MRAVRIGAADVVARPAKGEFMPMDRLLEAGAQAIMYPHQRSARSGTLGQICPAWKTRSGRRQYR